MGVSIILNESQLVVFDEAMKQRKAIEYKRDGNRVEFDRDNFYVARDRLSDYHAKLFIKKGRNEEQNEKLHNAIVVLGRMDTIAEYFDETPVTNEEDVTEGESTDYDDYIPFEGGK